MTSVNDRPVFTNTADVVLTPAISEGDTSIAYNLHTILIRVQPSPMQMILSNHDWRRRYECINDRRRVGVQYGQWGYLTAFADSSSPSDATALLFDISDTTVAPDIRFNASSGENGIRIPEVYAWDQTQTPNQQMSPHKIHGWGCESLFQCCPQYYFEVTAINDQPVLDITTSPITMTTINEGDSDSIVYSASVLISSEIGSTISDSDTGDSERYSDYRCL